LVILLAFAKQVHFEVKLELFFNVNVTIKVHMSSLLKIHNKVDFEVNVNTA